MEVKIYHNPRCSKSRATLALLKQRDIEPVVVEYLKTPPSADEIRDLIGLLGIGPADLLRTGEGAFRESGLTTNSPPDALIDLMAREPVVIERPIVVTPHGARIGRPPETVLELFD